MAKEEWTVVFDVKSAGMISPAVWAEKKLKVTKLSDGSTLEKNEGGINRAGIKTNTVQNAKIVTVIAESAEEAALAVSKFYGCGGQGATPAVLEAAQNGPKTSQFINGKMAAVVTGNLTEVAVI